MNAIVIILVVLILFLRLYKMYKPSIDIIYLGDSKIVLLWYNKYSDGKDTRRRTFKKLFTV